MQVWASELSPYALKLRACLQYAEVAHRWLPERGGWLEGLGLIARIARAKSQRTAIRHPRTEALDEYPAVPFLSDGEGHIYYDSSALARWLDERCAPDSGPLLPEPPALKFLAQLIDEAFDEFGLYMVHHNRWVLSASTNQAGDRLSQEMSALLTRPVAALLRVHFPRRQTRRLPYLFSVAPAGLPRRSPLPLPTPAGFPLTHALLDEAWERYLAAMERVLSEQPFLLGERFTLADASAYGQLSMNLVDGRAAERLRELAPITYTWLCEIRDGKHVGRRGPLRQTPALRPLLEILGETFVPLMEQNESAFLGARAAGESVFNERAFDAGRALYDGELMGRPFRAVVKTFQVQVWRELRMGWQELPSAQRPSLPAGIQRALDVSLSASPP